MRYANFNCLFLVHFEQKSESFLFYVISKALMLLHYKAFSFEEDFFVILTGAAAPFDKFRA